MEPIKVRVHELTLAYYTLRSLVHMEDIEVPADDVWPNIGAVFAEHLVKLKMKSFKSHEGRRRRSGACLPRLSYIAEFQ